MRTAHPHPIFLGVPPSRGRFALWGPHINNGSFNFLHHKQKLSMRNFLGVNVKMNHRYKQQVYKILYFDPISFTKYYSAVKNFQI